MVSFWPWSRDDDSTASFEKTLSALSTKISGTQARLDSMRSQSRRIRVLWTLYLSFAYLVYAIVVILVVGSHKMGTYEWSTVAGGPVVIYATRTTLAAYYNYRIESLSSRLKEQQTERAKTIKKLKEATKYNSTLELLEKYGGTDGKPSQPRKDTADDKDDNREGEGHDGRPRSSMGNRSNAGTPRRTNLPPPPTANIPRRQFSPVPGPPQPGHEGMPPQPQGDNPPGSVPVTEEFAPNAYSQSPPPPQAYARYEAATEPHWYDRVLDLLLGEDEMAAKNRIVLICKECKLVNGQAPPGVKTLSEAGMWKCMSCGVMNGEIDEGKKIVQEVLQARGKNESHRSDGPTHNDPEVELEEEEGGYQDEVEPRFVGGDSEGAQGNAGGARRRKGKK